jgi:hypothetical protein
MVGVSDYVWLTFGNEPLKLDGGSVYAWRKAYQLC